MEILKTRGIIINDDAFCLHVLSQLNYYRFTAYLIPFKLDDDKYKEVEFEKIYNIYEFDRKLRSLLLTILEEIELLLRTKFSYYHAHKYGSLGYMDESHYNPKHSHDNFLNEFNNLIIKNKDNLYVKHHVKNKNSEFPIWVAMELFPFGMLSKFYADMFPCDKKLIAKQDFNIGYIQLESWLLCISTLRNRCAHYMRLYYYIFNKWLSVPKDAPYKFSNKIFDYIYIMKYFCLDKQKWNDIYMNNLITLIKQYAHDIEPDHIGFPSNWEYFIMKNN